MRSDPEVAAAPETLRARKKRRTRETIARAAAELFSERGYHRTTIADVAEAADVSVSTVFGYFPKKDDLLFSGFDDMLADFKQWLDEIDEAESGIDPVESWGSGDGSRRMSRPGAEPLVAEELQRMILGDPALDATRLRRLARLE